MPHGPHLNPDSWGSRVDSRVEYLISKTKNKKTVSSLFLVFSSFTRERERDLHVFISPWHRFLRRKTGYIEIDGGNSLIRCCSLQLLMGDERSPTPMSSRDRDRELLIPVADSVDDGESKPSSSSSSASSHHSGREVGFLLSALCCRFFLNPCYFRAQMGFSHTTLLPIRCGFFFFLLLKIGFFCCFRCGVSWVWLVFAETPFSFFSHFYVFLDWL